MATGCRGSGSEIDLQLLDVLYEGVGAADGWDRFLSALTATYAGGRASIALHDTALPHDQPGVTAGWEPDRIGSYYQYYAARNPWLPRVTTRPVGTVVPAEYMLPRSDLLKSELYQEFLRPVGLDSGLGVTLQQDGSRVMLLSILYPSSTSERDQAALARVQRLVPHMLRVAQLNRQFAQLDAHAQAGAQMLDRLGIALFLLDGAGRVAAMTQVAEDILRQGNALVLRSGRLRARHAGEGQALDRLIAAARAGRAGGEAPPGGAIRLSGWKDGDRLEALVAPVDGCVIGRHEENYVAVILRTPASPPVCDPGLLQELYGLTRAEARLMRAMVAGETLESAALSFGVGRETLRSQLKSLGAKTGTSSQVDLVRLGAQSLAVRGQAKGSPRRAAG
jgi:DNA-binding CsgD family transcriptional regulator